MKETPKSGAAATARARIVYVEECPSRDISYHYILDDADAVIKVPSSPKVLGKAVAPSSSHDVNASRRFLFFRSVFLPAGFPHSVSRDYVAYQTWDTVQAFASSISSSLATRAVLKGVGVGDESATALSATLTWLLRDGAGMAGGIAFTWLRGTDLDHACKKWRLFADVLNDAAMMLELSGPLFPKASFHLVLCAASVARSLVGVAGGATRTAVTQHQARANNISDVAAKDGSQETLVNLFALVLNLMLLPLLGESQGVIWSLFLCLMAIHLYANFCAVRSLMFETLNRERLLHNILAYRTSGRTLSIEEGNARESVFAGFGLDEVTALCGRRIEYGTSFSRLANQFAAQPMALKDIVGRLEADRFFVFHPASSDILGVVFHSTASPRDMLLGYISACFTAIGSQNVEKDCASFLGALKESGWSLEHLQLNTNGWTGQKESRPKVN